MSSRDMQELNIKLWESELNRCIAEEHRLKKIMGDDPTSMLLDCHCKFKDLLKKYQGKERLTPQFKAEIGKLARKEKRAKLLKESYDMMDAMDKYHEAKMKTGNVSQELNSYKFRYSLHWERNKEKKEAMIVKDIVEKVSK